jgi:Ran GTPase-activating protein (RanGAP) involved in mRNA processing and transport
MAVIISKKDILASYLSRCEAAPGQKNLSLVKYLERQVTVQEEEEKRVLENDGEYEEGIRLDLIVRGNDPLNFTARITNEHLIPLVSVIEEHAYLIQYIDLSYNHISDAGAITLSRILKPAIELKTLNLQSNNILPDGTEAICTALKDHQSLQYINLNGNSIKTRGAISLVDLLFSSLNILELDLGNNGIDHDGIIALTTALNKARLNLEVLNLENPSLNSVMQETAVHFGKMLSINTNLKKLSLRKMRLRCDGIFTLTNHLVENSRLRVLDLSCNEISADGAGHIARFLKSEECRLESLILAVNKVVDLGGKYLAQALSLNRSLIHIDITSNRIGDEGLARIAESLFHNQVLMSFKLFGNHFGQQALRLFHRLFKAERDFRYYADFETYEVDDEVQMAYVDQQTPNDVNL